VASVDVIVVGGGCAGLSAATALVERGAHVQVIEARPVLGGRASAVRDPATGERVDNGQHVLMGCYDETFRFLGRIGTAGLVRRQAGLAVPMIERGGRTTTLQLPPLAAPLHLVAGVMAWDALPWRDKLAVARIGPAIDRHRARSASADPSDARDVLARSTVRQWLAAHHQPARIVELLWEPLALAALNQPIDEASATTFVEVLARMFGPEAERAALVVPAVTLDDLYAEPARRWLEARGSAVRTSAPARIRVFRDRVVGVEVRGEAIVAPSVVSTVPWFALRRAFVEPPLLLETVLQHADATASSPIVTVNLWFDRPVMSGMLVGLPGRTFQWVFDKGVAFGRDRSHLSLISSGAAEEVARSNEALIALAHREVADALPMARTARLVHASAIRERHATFSLAPGQPGRPGTRTPIDGLLLAGDWIDTGLPATIESAVDSGHRAAALAA
jgi:zeta-carotene desaturase